MCGRYAITKTGELKDRYPAAYVGTHPDGDRFNVAPTQNAPVVTREGIEMMKWGLIPSWAKGPKMPFSTFNARGESVAEKPMFRGPFKHHRCLVPASGFYEWLKEGTAKRPFFFFLPDEPVFSLAGLYDEWHDTEGHPLRSFTIITTTANKLMEPVHDRMPVILTRQEEQDWLDPQADPDELQLMLDPFDAAKMDSYEVSTEVNKSSSQGQALMQPINSQ